MSVCFGGILKATYRLADGLEYVQYSATSCFD